ncbi:MAG: hypothetical protein ACE5G5_00700 [Candidatus Methylomirabilales bacterium]
MGRISVIALLAMDGEDHVVAGPTDCLARMPASRLNAPAVSFIDEGRLDLLVCEPQT